MSRQEFGVPLVDMRGVREHHHREIPRRRRAPDRSPIPLPHEQRKPPSVVNVRMGKHYGIDSRNLNGQPLVLLLSFPSMSLKQPAVQQDVLVVDPHDVAGPGNFTCGASECELHALLVG